MNILIEYSRRPWLKFGVVTVLLLVAIAIVGLRGAAVVGYLLFLIRGIARLISALQRKAYLDNLDRQDKEMAALYYKEVI